MDMKDQVAEMHATLKAVAENQQYQRKKLDKIDVLMSGNGSPEQGMIVRFDRVEQWWIDYTKKKNRMAVMMGTSILGFFGSVGLLVVRIIWGV